MTEPRTELDVAAELRRLLPAWLGTRRWFADKGAEAPTVEPVLVEVLAEGIRRCCSPWCTPGTTSGTSC